ncbi:MAG: hypothetical protein V7L21_23650 [Nostoc sp.]|uniref:hypothetical protein n=1 Tax=Nostoc sp. TaxID=1180 RepID=UPI002FF9E647
MPSTARRNSKFKIDALYETLRVACFPVRLRRLALSVGAASGREAMPLAFAQRVADKPLVRVSVSEREEKALRCANKIQTGIQRKRFVDLE